MIPARPDKVSKLGAPISKSPLKGEKSDPKLGPLRSRGGYSIPTGPVMPNGPRGSLFPELLKPCGSLRREKLEACWSNLGPVKLRGPSSILELLIPNGLASCCLPLMPRGPARVFGPMTPYGSPIVLRLLPLGSSIVLRPTIPLETSEIREPPAFRGTTRVYLPSLDFRGPAKLLRRLAYETPIVRGPRMPAIPLGPRIAGRPEIPCPRREPWTRPREESLLPTP